MNQPSKLSQDSKQLAKQIVAQQQQLKTLQVATEAAQSEWDDRRKQIANDTEITIQLSREAIEAATKEAKTALENLEKDIALKKNDLGETESGYKRLVAQRKAQNEELDLLGKVLVRTNAALREENRVLTSEIEVRKESIADLKHSEEHLTTQLAQLKVQDEQAADHLVELRKQEQNLSNEIDQLRGDFAAKTEDFTHQLTLLEAKQRDMEQQIIDTRTADDKVRENLASWQKTLDEKDKNLRIRQQKIDQQQTAIARNYNLLNL